jgi:hypothetical protein
MLKPLFLAGALLAATTSVVKVAMDSNGVTVGTDSLTTSTLQLKKADGGHCLASMNVIESIGGVVEVTVDGGTVRLDPGVRLTRAPLGYELSSHGRRQIIVAAGASTLLVSSPVTIVPENDGWKVGTDGRLEGGEIRVALLNQVDATRVAAGETGTTTPETAGTPPPTKKLDIRRVLYIDPRPSAEQTEEQSLKTFRPFTKTIKSVDPVSPSGSS